jgi:hypothetical protein
MASRAIYPRAFLTRSSVNGACRKRTPVRARVVADAMQDKQAKQLMLCVAKDYERVAKLAERRLQRGTRQREKPRWRRTGAFALLLAAALQEHMFDCSTALVKFGF